MEHALADHGRTLPRPRQTALMAAFAAQKGVDSTTVIFVGSTFAQMDEVLKIGSAAAVVIQPFLSRVTASNDGTLLAYYVRDIRPGVSGAVFAAREGYARPTPPAIRDN